MLQLSRLSLVAKKSASIFGRNDEGTADCCCAPHPILAHSGLTACWAGELLAGPPDAVESALRTRPGLCPPEVIVKERPYIVRRPQVPGRYVHPRPQAAAEPVYVPPNPRRVTKRITIEERGQAGSCRVRDEAALGRALTSS